MSRGAPPRATGFEPAPAGRPKRARMSARQVGIHALGLALMAGGGFGMVQAQAASDLRAEQLELVAVDYRAAQDRLEAARDSVDTLPRSPEAARWVVAAHDVAGQVAAKQHLLLKATGEHDPSFLDYPREVVLPSGEVDQEATQEAWDAYRAQRVAQTERELVMLFSADARGGGEFNASGHWHEEVEGLPADASAYDWEPTVTPVLGEGYLMDVDWVLRDPSGTAVAVVTGVFDPRTNVVESAQLHVLGEGP